MIGTKICGLTQADHVKLATKNGAKFIGFVMHPKSPRDISVAQAAGLVKHAKPAQTVIVMVNPDDTKLAEIFARFTPDYIQLHGAESDVDIQNIKAKYGCKVIKAIGISNKADLAKAANYPHADMLLFDAKPPKDAQIEGGNGVSFDWEMLKGFSCDKPWMLSGGLNANNIEAAIRTTNAKFIDISSGVEKDYGVKSGALIEKFLQKLDNIQ